MKEPPKTVEDRDWQKAEAAVDGGGGSVRAAAHSTSHPIPEATGGGELRSSKAPPAGETFVRRNDEKPAYTSQVRRPGACSTCSRGVVSVFHENGATCPKGATVEQCMVTQDVWGHAFVRGVRCTRDAGHEGAGVGGCYFEHVEARAREATERRLEGAQANPRCPHYKQPSLQNCCTTCVRLDLPNASAAQQIIGIDPAKPGSDKTAVQLVDTGPPFNGVIAAAAFMQGSGTNEEWAKFIERLFAASLSNETRRTCLADLIGYLRRKEQP